ncbi:MAG: glutamate--tRNA ligase [Candidatus Thermoplasmatota archaeon]
MVEKDQNQIRETAEKYALQNALNFEGKAEFKSVIGKVIGELKKEGFSPKEILPVVREVVKKVNQFSMDEQRQRLKEINPSFFEKEEKKSCVISLPDLPDAAEGKVVTRFPPEPNGFLHIGHAKASIIDYEYACRYDGRFILRFDDTNPENAHEEFYEAQKEDLRWLGISWDEEYCTSDNLEKHYELAEQLIRQGDAYICRCKMEDIRRGRYRGECCECRECDCEENLEDWKKMLDGSLDGVVLRLKGDMTCDNTAMRDPTLFRIIEKPHPRQGDKYRVWPTYDFAGAVEDSLSGVTHPFRTKEYELRDECYFRLLELLDVRKPYLMEFSRLSIEGMPVSKRKIKPLIEEGKVDGFDDPRLPTLRGLRRRGITPDAIRKFVLSLGISKSESMVPFSLLESENRKIIDPKARRFFFVPNPVKLVVEDAPEKKEKLSYHPSNEEMGYRTVETGENFYVSRDDADSLSEGEVFRLKDLYNVRINSCNEEIHGVYAGEELISDSAKIQWTTDEYIPFSVYVSRPLFKNDEFNPGSLEEVKGFVEKNILDAENDEIVQFERFGFVRIEKKDDEIKGFFAHK